MFHFKILANISATYTSIRDARWFYFCVRFLTYLKETNKHWCSFVYCRQDPYTVHLSKVLYFEVWFSLFYSFEVGKLIMIGSLSCEPCFFFFFNVFFGPFLECLKQEHERYLSEIHSSHTLPFTGCMFCRHWMCMSEQHDIWNQEMKK